MSQEKAAEIIDLNASRAAAEAGEETAGEFLAGARRAAGLDLGAVSNAIKVKVDHLAAIEASDAAALPATPYAVGFVKVYAKYLGLDAEAVATKFKTDIAAAAPPPEELKSDTARDSSDLGEGAKLASIFGVIAIVMFALWVVFQIAGNSERETGASGAGPDGAEVILRDERAPAPRPRPSVRSELTSGLASEPTPIAPVEDSTVSETADATPANADETSEAPQTATDTAAPEPLAPEPLASETASPAIDVRSPSRVSAPAPAPEPVVTEARLIRSIAPRYPNACDREAEDVEKVMVIFDITAEGRTANTRVVSSTNACFNEAALSALGRWRFDPKTVDGAPRPDVAKHATLNFRK